MNEYTIVANTGIQITTFPMHLELIKNGKNKEELLFQEFIDATDLRLDLLKEMSFEDDDPAIFLYGELESEGFLAPDYFPTYELILSKGIQPIDEEEPDDNGYTPIFTVNDKTLQGFLLRIVNHWIPIPYYRKLGEWGFDAGAYNWARMKLVPIGDSTQDFTVILAFDTRIHPYTDPHKEGPSFPDNMSKDLRYGLCTDKLQLMDYCAYNHAPNQYIYEYLFKVVHPGCGSLDDVHDANKLEFIANYILLLDCIGRKGLFPDVVMHRDGGQCNLDLVVDIGNSRTMAILVEEGRFEDSQGLELLNYTNLINKGGELNITKGSFDMRVVFRKVSFSTPLGSHQFCYPSLVRLGEEANSLMCQASHYQNVNYSTNSSPKRYLWDDKPSFSPWEFLQVEGESGNASISVQGITDQLNDDGTVKKDAGNSIGGLQTLYSRRSLMTFAFLEILTQARRQVNSHSYRTRMEDKTSKRVVKRLVVTCPTAWSKTEREALINCAKDAAELLCRFYHEATVTEVIPQMTSRRDANHYWYYDEATCSQLVYMYGEIYKYQSNLDILFELWGKKGTDNQQSITVGSLDIGAGTSDLMIGEYTYTMTNGLATVTPNPLFYDSYYYAGDDMLQNLVQSVMYLDEDSAIRKSLSHLSRQDYVQKLRNLFGKDYAGQSADERTFRRLFNLQYAVPLMSYFLKLSERSNDACDVSYSDVFQDNQPNEWVRRMFSSKVGVELESLVWRFDPEKVDGHIFKEFEPLLKMVATIMHNTKPSCDVVLISGRPASLPAIRRALLKYYPTSPDRVILVNKHHVGMWYPFSCNTGYVDDPKTVVAVGALVALYGTKMNTLNVKIDLTKLNNNLHSTINNVYYAAQSEKYVLSDAKPQGEFQVPSLPAILHVRQLDVDSYLSRPLYVVDYNKHKLAASIKNASPSPLTPKEVMRKVKDKIDLLQQDAPFTIRLERDVDDKEKLVLVSILNGKGEDMKVHNVEIHIQSMGINEKYWLDTGSFEF